MIYIFLRKSKLKPLSSIYTSYTSQNTIMLNKDNIMVLMFKFYRINIFLHKNMLYAKIIT